MLSMEKIFNVAKVTLSVVCGVLANLFGGVDLLLKTIIMLVLLDYVTGIVKAVYLKKISSSVGFKGILKKITIFIVICFSYLIQNFLQNSIPLREIVISFFIANEGISILENAAILIPIPQKLKDVLLQLQEKEHKK